MMRIAYLSSQQTKVYAVVKFCGVINSGMTSRLLNWSAYARVTIVEHTTRKSIYIYIYMYSVLTHINDLCVS